MLLQEDTLPVYGVLDYLVESNLKEVDASFFADLHAPSRLAEGHGVVRVVPALGRRSVENPRNVLSKIARAYLTGELSTAEAYGFTHKIEHLISSLTNTGDYDVVLVDARAGLHESTAAAAVGLRGDTLLFGIDQPQTYAGYRALFAQLAETLGSEWKSRFHFVEARVGASGPSSDFISAMLAAMPGQTSVGLEGVIPLEQLRDVFDVEWDLASSAFTDIDPDNEVDTTYIYDSDLFRGFDPLKDPGCLTDRVYAAVFGEFIQTCLQIIDYAERSQVERE
jgi:hypothetical protein